MFTWEAWQEVYLPFISCLIITYSLAWIAFEIAAYFL